MGNQLSALDFDLVCVAKGNFFLQANPVWETMQGFLAAITRTAAGHYRIQRAQNQVFGNKTDLIDLCLGGAAGAVATPPSFWWNITTTTITNDTLDLWVSVNGAAADFGTMTVTITRLLGGPPPP